MTGSLSRTKWEQNHRVSGWAAMAIEVGIGGESAATTRGLVDRCDRDRRSACAGIRADNADSAPDRAPVANIAGSTRRFLRIP
jgi:hypothetical protein